MKRTVGFVLAMLCVAGLACSTQANPPEHAEGNSDLKVHNGDLSAGTSDKSAKGNKHEAAAGHSRSELLSATISELAAREMALQGGWINYEPLPPGIARNLARGKALPPGIARKPVPHLMLKKLPSYPGYNWYAAGKDLILISANGMVIADVLHNVFD